MPATASPRVVKVRATSVRKDKDAHPLFVSLDSMPVPFATLNRQLRFTRVNKAFTKWINLEPAQLINRTVFNASPVLSKCAAAMHRVLRTGKPTLRLVMRSLNQAFTPPLEYGRFSFFPLQNKKTPTGVFMMIESHTSHRRQVDRRQIPLEYLSQAVLRSLRGHVAIIDQKGIILAVNEAWQRAKESSHSPALMNAMKGANYLVTCQQADVGDLADSQRIHAGVKAVLGGSKESFSFEHSFSSPSGLCWYLMEVVPLQRVEGGAVVTHLDITENKRTQLEAQQGRSELAHVQRASTIGELASSLAHELNQPLAAILSNAQAAVRFMKANPDDHESVSQILTDIIADDKRAGEVIRRMRALLKKKELEHKQLQTNEIVYEVSQILHSDAIIRRTMLVLDLSPDLPMIYGDPIQLQQVLLNLMLNGLDAMKTTASDRRVLQIRTSQVDTKTVRLSVIDAGIGIEKNQLDRIFEPFYTTKKEGLGMGLTISRSIVEAHRGRLWAETNEVGGATFHFTLGIDPSGVN